MDHGARAAMAEWRARVAMAEREAWEAMAGSPPPKFSWGISSSPGGALEALPLGALESWTEPAGTLESWTEPAGALESWAEQALEDAGEEPALEDAGEEPAPEDAGEEQAREDAGKEQALENLKPPQGWTGPAGTTERGEGASRTPAQSPSHLSPPPCPAVPDVLSAPLLPRCRGLHSALTPSMAGSLVVDIVTGSRT